jgi:23S rRNA (pseudouridine1915-N3)-methyltransferase
MKIELWTVGETSFDFVKTGCSLYEKRLQQYYSFQSQVIPYLKNAKNLSEEQQKEREGEQILKKLQSTDQLILLDERGKSYSSLQLADWLEAQLQRSQYKRLVVLIGGAYGFSQTVYQRAQGQISLSPMTFSHQLVRLLALEQLYRAASILHGHPYHHE